MKQYWYILSGAFLAGIILLILTDKNKEDYYTVTTEDVHRISTSQELLINSNDLKKYYGSSLLIHLAVKPEKDFLATSDKEIYIESSDLLKRKNRKIYANSPGLLVLVSEDIEIAAKAWTIMSRKGYENIRIMDNNTNESFKYSFQPDSIAGPK